MTSETAYPLAWPMGRPRCKSRARSRFGTYWEKPSVAKAREALSIELERMGASNPVLSTNMELRLDGQPRSDRRYPGDPGAAVYFTLGKQRMVLACDCWLTVGDNIWAIAKTIEAQRGIERWGSVSANQAFAGYAALPERTGADVWEVLGITPSASEAEIMEAYRSKAKAAHPDKGGSHELFAALSQAKDIALATARSRGA
jgi:hypothetical protein